MGFFVVCIMACASGTLAESWVGAFIIGLAVGTAYFIGRSGV